MSPLMTLKETAAYLRVSESSLRHGWGPPPHPAYKRQTYYRPDVLEWVLKNRVKADPNPEVVQQLVAHSPTSWVPEHGWVYFARQQGRLDRIKIGHSIDPHHRIKSLATGSPYPMELLDVWRGSQALEEALHRALDAHRVHLEWFSYVEDLDTLLRSDLADSFRDCRVLSGC